MTAGVANQTYQVAKGTAMADSAGKIGIFDGLDAKARTEQLDRAFEGAGFTDTFSGMLAKNGSVSMNLNDDQAQVLFGQGPRVGPIRFQETRMVACSSMKAPGAERKTSLI